MFPVSDSLSCWHLCAALALLQVSLVLSCLLLCMVAPHNCTSYKTDSMLRQNTDGCLKGESLIILPHFDIHKPNSTLWANVNDTQICGLWAYLVHHKYIQRPAVWENKTRSSRVMKVKRPLEKNMRTKWSHVPWTLPWDCQPSVNRNHTPAEASAAMKVYTFIQSDGW